MRAGSIEPAFSLKVLPLRPMRSAHLNMLAAASVLSVLMAGAPALGAGLPSHAVRVHDDVVQMEVSALNEDVLRVRIGPRDQPAEDASWVVPDEVRGRTLNLPATQNGSATEVRTQHLNVRIDSAPLRLTVADSGGHVISADAPERAIEIAGGVFMLRKLLPEAEHYFGLGDKTGPLDRRGETFVNWNSDSYGFGESTDPIYKSIPFFVGVGGAGGSYGIFLDNTFRTWFDFGHKEPNALSFGSSGGPIDYYLIYGPSTSQVIQRYTELTGRPPLPPLWSLGFQQSRYSYMSSAEVRRIATRMRAERLPADVIYLDIDYQDRNRPFTTNPQAFPDIPGLAKGLHGMGFRLIAITDMHVAAAAGQSYQPYDTGLAGDHFIKGPSGSLYVGEVWPGPSVFPDFTRSVTRDWWGGLYRQFLSDGIAGFWNDMNEPAVFKTASKTMPLDNLHRIDEPGFAPRVATHAEIHNIYGMENSRATYDGLRRLAPDERAYVLTRASFAGGQRYAATWTGDNTSNWNHLKLSVSMLLNLGLSGFAYSGSDVGGFIGAPNADLMTRWIEIASFTPYFRAHSAKDTPRKEPWVDGPRHTDIRRKFIEQRYRLLPYFYALADENSRSGAPLMRPVFYEFPRMLDSPCDQSTAFLLGEALLITPSPNLESPASYEACLPPGGWYDYWSGDRKTSTRADDGSAERLNITPDIASLPVFVRAGSIIPRQPLVQSTLETPNGALTLDVYPGDNCHGVLYWDDGHSMAYKLNGYLRQKMRCAVRPDGLDLQFEAREGEFKPWWHQLEVRIHDWHGTAVASLNGKPLPDPAVTNSGVAQFTIPDVSNSTMISLSHASAPRAH
jgi:alpha-glucosidase